jgi:hypothetical protein
MEPVSVFIAMAKNALALNLETPFMVVSGLIGLLGVPSMTAGDNFLFHTPLEAFSKLSAWLGWKSGGTWFNGVHTWMNTPVRHDGLHFAFSMLAFVGIAFASVGTRLMFVAVLSIGGLVEVGATSAAWVIPLLAVITAVGVGRLLRIGKSDPWDAVQGTCLHLMLGLIYAPLLVVSVLVGERAKPV